MKEALVALTVAILLLSLFPAVALAAPPANPAPVSDFSSENILVKFKAGTGLPEAAG